jgi:hypothetical protein
MDLLKVIAPKKEPPRKTATYDEGIENIDQHVKTKVLSTQEIVLGGVRRTTWPAGGAGDVATDTIWDAMGDVVYGTGSDTGARLAAGTSGQYLMTQSTGAAPIWSAPSGSGDVVGPASAVSGQLCIFNGTTGKLIKDGGVVPTSNATHTGEVTGATGLTIANDAVTYAKMQNVSATDKVLGRATAGAGDVEEIACTAAGRAILDDVDAAAQRTTLGLGTIATQAANSVTISGGSVTGITYIAVADGGTGASTAAQAATNLGLGTGDSPQFTAVNIGAAADTTLARVSAGVVSVEGATVILSGAALGTPASGTLTNCTGLPAASSLVANMEASDHGTAATDMLVNVCYGTGAAPTASTTTEGTIYLTYTA